MPGQRTFVEDESEFVVAQTTRRAGKTTGDVIKGLLKVSRRPQVAGYYVTITRELAAELAWEPLKRFNRDHHLGGEPNETKLSIQLPNGSLFRCGGCKDRQEAEKWRGRMKVAIAIVDEGQSFRDSVLEYLINEILEPSMIDVDGQIVLSGTPGLVPYGYFFNATQNPRFAQHRWSLRDNPHLEVPPDVFLARIRERRGITEADPGYRREYLGEWVKDENALVIKYDPHLNHYEDSELPGGKWTHVMGVDLGFVDSDAITIQGWSDRAPVVYKLAEDKRSKANLTELMATVMEMFRRWNPIRVVVDPGGIGAKLIDELKRRHGLPCEAAEKVRKFEHIELLNDALRTGRFKAKRDSAFAEEAMKAQWDMDSRARGILKVCNAYHPDMLDADLYAFRHCAHYLWEPDAAKPDAEQQLDAWERAESERIERRKEGGWADDAAGKMGYE